MRVTQRQRDYRRRRQRAALHRRGVYRPTPPDACLIGSAGEPAERIAQLLEGRDAATGVVALAQRLCLYPTILGLLQRPQQDSIDCLIVAPPPLTTGIRLLVRLWSEALTAAGPHPRLTLRVSPTAPPADSGYRCVFWREPRQAAQPASPIDKREKSF